jgi:membrane-associated phospholipid phosphatase
LPGRPPTSSRLSPSAQHLLAELDAVDRAVYAAVAAVPTPTLDAGLARLSDAANGSRLWLAIAVALSLTGPGPRRSAARGVVAIGLTSAVTNLLAKPVLRRRRPDRAGARVPGTRNVLMPASRSFPSGHAASAYSFATVVGHELPWAAVPLRLLASAVAYSRVHTGVHYPGDVLAGALLGAGCGHVVTSLSNRLAPHALGTSELGDGVTDPDQPR